jgi:hypothetical protein
MNLQEYVRGLIIWSLVASLVIFWMVFFIAQQSDSEVIVITTKRLIAVLLFTNAILTATLVNINRR